MPEPAASATAPTIVPVPEAIEQVWVSPVPGSVNGAVTVTGSASGTLPASGLVMRDRARLLTTELEGRLSRRGVGVGRRDVDESGSRPGRPWSYSSRTTCRRRRRGPSRATRSAYRVAVGVGSRCQSSWRSGLRRPRRRRVGDSRGGRSLPSATTTNSEIMPKVAWKKMWQWKTHRPRPPPRVVPSISGRSSSRTR